MLKRQTKIENLRRAGWLSILILCIASTSQALDPNKAPNEFGLQVWLTENGLPQNTVQAITQTRDGYLWIGTQEGLARFNSVGFVVFDKDNTPQMKSNDIRALLEDKSGALWIGTSYGLLRYQGGAFTTFTTNERLPEPPTAWRSSTRTRSLALRKSPMIFKRYCLTPGTIFGSELLMEFVGLRLFLPVVPTLLGRLRGTVLTR